MSYFTRYMDKCSRLHSFPVTRYNFVFIKIFAGGRLDNDTKMSTNNNKTRTSRSCPRLALLHRR